MLNEKMAFLEKTPADGDGGGGEGGGAGGEGGEGEAEDGGERKSGMDYGGNQTTPDMEDWR